MKRLFISTILILVTLNFFAQDGNKNHAKWSLGIKGGGNSFRITPKNPSFTSFESFTKTIGWNPSAFIEVSPNSNYGFGLEAGYFNYDRTINKTDYFGNSIDAVIFGSLNLSNIAAPCRTGFWKHVNLYANFGLGSALYTYKNPGDSDYKDRTATLLGVGGLNLEFSLGKLFGLFLEGQYRYYASNTLGGTATANQRGNDAIALNLGLRWKINGRKKDHVRNLTPCISAPVVTKAPKAEADPELVNRLKSAEIKNKAIETKLQQMHTENSEANEKLEKLEKELDRLKNALNNQSVNQGSTGQTNQNNNSSNSENLNKYYSNNDVAYIEFCNNTSDLNEANKLALSQIVNSINNDKNWKQIKISGHSDATGNPDYNVSLSKQRAEAVYNYIVKQGVDASKVVFEGYGSNNPIADNDTPEGRQKNRRVEIQVVK